MHGVHLLLLWLDAGMLELHSQSRPEVSRATPFSCLAFQAVPPSPFGYRFLCCVLLHTLTLHDRPAAIYEIFAIFRDYMTKGPLLVYAGSIARHEATKSLFIVVKLGI